MLRATADDGGPYDAIAVRFVHGGPDHTAPCGSTRRCSTTLEAVSDLAPLHNPPALDAARDLLERHPDVPVVACFDTDLPHHDPAGGGDVRPAAGVERALAAAPLRLPRALPRVGGAAGGRAGRAAARGAADGDLPPRRRRLAVRGARGPVGRHHDGVHAAGGAGDADPQRLGRPRPDAAPAAPRGVSRRRALRGPRPRVRAQGAVGDVRRLPGGARRAGRPATRPRRSRSTSTCTGWCARPARWPPPPAGSTSLVFTGGVGEHAAELRAAVAAGLGASARRDEPEPRPRRRGDVLGGRGRRARR